MEVLRRMQPVLEEGLLRELKNVLHMVFAGCDVAQKADITDGDISSYLRAYKNIRAVKNSTLKGVRAVYSSFFAWLRDRDRVRRNPMVLVESIKVEKKGRCT